MTESNSALNLLSQCLRLRTFLYFSLRDESLTNSDRHRTVIFVKKARKMSSFCVIIVVVPISQKMQRRCVLDTHFRSLNLVFDNYHIKMQ